MSVNNNCISSLEKCFSNVELVTNICKFLNYEDQYKLLKVSKDFYNIIINYVWKSQFKEVKVITNGTIIIVSDRIDTFSKYSYGYKPILKEIIQTNNMILEKHEMEIFLNLNANNIKKLNIKIFEKPMHNTAVKFPLKQTFRNLTSICYYRVTLTDEDLRIIAESCEKLESLILAENLNLQDGRLLLDEDINIQTIKSMLNLKKLIINDHKSLCLPRGGAHKFSNIKNILHQLKLSHLILDARILPATSTNDNVLLDLRNLKKSCTAFQIGPFVESSDYLNFQTNFLPNFENVCNLTLKGVNITKEFFAIILKSCKKLTHLTLWDCYIDNFIALPQLQEIELISCKGLSGLSLKTLLHEMHLKYFKSSHTDFGQDLENFNISSSLQKFEFHNLHNNKLVNLFRFQHTPLKELTKFQWILNHKDDYNFTLSNLVPNLEVLDFHQQYFKNEDLANLKFLQKIIISFADQFTMSHLCFLLKQNIRELSLSYINNFEVDFNLTKFPAFKTKVMYLGLPCSVFKITQDFFLGLLIINKNLSLMCNQIDAYSLYALIADYEFLHHFKTINICGVAIDFRKFLYNEKDETLKQIDFIMDIFEKMNLESYIALQYV